MAIVYLSLGSNLGKRKKNLREAIRFLGENSNIKIKRISSFYETEPIGPPQPKYINAAIELETELNPFAILFECKKIEGILGREPSSEKWGPRPIDLDILLYNDEIINESDLVIPHPLMHKRKFVLKPLAEIAPEVIHPMLNKRIKKLLQDETHKKD